MSERQLARLEREAPLARYTSVRVGGPADLFTVARGSDDLLRAVRWAQQAGIPFMILGSGSNVVISDLGYRGLVIKCMSRAVEVVAEGDAGVVVELDGGTFLPTAAKLLAEQGIAGLEWGVGIPGTAGGAVVGNAGAYGGVTSQTLTSILALTSSGEQVEIGAERLALEYRASAIKHGALDAAAVLRARHTLRRGDGEELLASIRHYLAERRRKQPSEPSVGSTFKNPDGDFAARLIEGAGLKGACIGGAMVSPRHANYVVNTGGATAEDVRALVEHMRAVVHRSTGVELETEIEFKGEW